MGVYLKPYDWRVFNYRFNKKIKNYYDWEYDTQNGLLLKEKKVEEGMTAVEQFGHFIVEHLPDNILQQHKLVRRSDAVRQLHLPKTLDEFQAAKRRLIFEDLLEFQVGLALRRRREPKARRGFQRWRQGNRGGRDRRPCKWGRLFVGFGAEEMTGKRHLRSQRLGRARFALRRARLALRGAGSAARPRK